MTERRRYDLVFAVYLTSGGFAFVLFEGPSTPVDWGIVERRGKAKNARCFERLHDLIESLRPDSIVLEKIVTSSSRRAARIVKLNLTLETYLEGRRVPFFRYTRDDVRRTFAHLPAVTKETIAEAISHQIPAFLRYVPPKRRPWMSQDARMGLFDAAALALTYFQERGGGQAAMTVPKE